MSQVELRKHKINGLAISMPEIWNVDTEMYTEPDGRECTMIEISAEEETQDQLSSVTVLCQKDPMP